MSFLAMSLIGAWEQCRPFPVVTKAFDPPTPQLSLDKPHRNQLGLVLLPPVLLLVHMLKAAQLTGLPGSGIEQQTQNL